ncbi:HAD family hydrolase [Myxococcota bacterium]|nr:HAD family hydrolase [Myxococcota bacterium]
MASLLLNMAEQLKAVFFDLGGTLFSYRDLTHVLSGVMEEAVVRLGVKRGKKEVGGAFFRASHQAANEFLEQDYYLHRDLFVTTYRYWVEGIEAQADDDFYEWFYQAQRDALVEGTVRREDCFEALDGLLDRGLRLSIVSNIDDDYLDPIIDNMGLASRFDHVSSSEEARSCKPHSGIYHYALEKAKLRPEEVLFVGDSARHDIRGARDVGMLSALIEEVSVLTAEDTDSPSADYTIEKLTDLLSVVDEIMSERGEDS